MTAKRTDDNRFYGDPVEKFRAMSNSTGGCDDAHFRMWCSIAAEEIEQYREAAKLAYGLLWHDHSTNSLAQEARRVLRDAMTHNERGAGIDAARKKISELQSRRGK